MADAIGQGGGFEIRSRGDVSDHGPFALRGRPAALLFSGVTDYYHSPDDTPDRLKLEDIRRSG
ncbi:MAG TPA: hypothetical protein VHF25_16265, partial [Nitriliruptorales bacterium]|nr:hypothetical protein [Nitriliruptorales bacterium]